MHLFAHAYAHVHTRVYAHVRTYVVMHVYTRPSSLFTSGRGRGLCLAVGPHPCRRCECVWTFVWTFVRTCVWMCIDMCMDMCMDVYRHVYGHVYRYVHRHVHGHVAITGSHRAVFIEHSRSARVLSRFCKGVKCPKPHSSLVYTG